MALTSTLLGACALALPAWGQAPAPSADGGTTTAEQDESALEGLLSESVTSAGSRTAESASDAPGTTWTISGTDLRRFGIQSVEEAIRFLGHAMTSYEYDMRLNAAFGSRGYNSDNLGLHLAVLIDGNQAGGSAMTARGTQPYLMPIELVDHLDIIIGPGSVIYGNSAMLGVINVVTKSYSSIDKTEVVLQGSAGLPGDHWASDLSWGEVWGRAAVFGKARFELGGDPFELVWHFATRWDRQQGRSLWRLISGADPYAPDPFASFTREDAFNRDFDARLFAQGTWGHWSFLGWVAYAQGTGTGAIEGSAASSYIQPEYGLDATWTKRVSDRGDFSFRAYGVVFDSQATTPSFPIDTASCVSTLGVPNCASILHDVNFKPYVEPIFKWDWKRDGVHVTTFGGQAFIDGSVITTGTLAIGGPQKAYDLPIWAPLPSGALYAQHIWRAPFGILNLGLRGDVGILGSALSPRIAYSRPLGQDTTLKLVASTGFRNPTITERYLEITNFLTSNPNIGPERVYSVEADLARRLGFQNVQASLFATYWQGMITTHNVDVDGQSLSQFANLRNVMSAGVNLGWVGMRGPIDWALSVNYAPGRIRLPADAAAESDAQLQYLGILRQSVAEYGQSALNSVFLPAEGMPDFYSTGHLSLSLGEGLPRLSFAASLRSPCMRVGYLSDAVLIDPRNVGGPVLPWSIDVRGAVEMPLRRFMVRLVVTASSLTTAPDQPRVGGDESPLPSGGVGTSSNPVSPLSAMLELGVRL